MIAVGIRVGCNGIVLGVVAVIDHHATKYLQSARAIFHRCIVVGCPLLVILHLTVCLHTYALALWTDGFDADDGTDLGPSALIFNGVTLTKDLYEDEISTDDSGTTTVTFMGTYKKLTFDADDRTVLYLGADNTLYYPQNGASIGAQRAYFKLSGLSVGNIANSAIVLNFGDGETTGIGSIDNGELRIDNDDWYSLDGRRLSGKPTAHGIYINNGKKVVIK